LKILLSSHLLLLHLGIKSTSANASITNNNTPAMDIQTTLLFFPPELDFSDEDGPSACFPGVLREDGDGGAPESGGVGVGGGGDGDVGAGNGAEEVLNGLPSFLQQVSILANK
jgi:hypothetical protein